MCSSAGTSSGLSPDSLGTLGRTMTTTAQITLAAHTATRHKAGRQMLPEAQKQYQKINWITREGKYLCGQNLAPQVGLEPTTLRLTAECSAIELLRSAWRLD